MNRGEKGDTGRTGDQGRTGDTGATGDSGLAGLVGPQGVRGQPGKTLPKNITRPFIVLVAVAFAVLAFMGWQLNQNRKLIRSNRDLIAAQTQDRANLTKKLAQTDLLNCQAVETTRALIREQLRASVFVGQAEAIRRFAPLKGGCQALPSVRGNIPQK